MSLRSLGDLTESEVVWGEMARREFALVLCAAPLELKSSREHKLTGYEKIEAIQDCFQI